MNSLKFKYIVNIKNLIFPIIFSLACCFIFAHKALTNNKNIILYDIIKLSTNKATIFIWCLFGCSLIFLTLFIYVLYNLMLNKSFNQGIIITDSSISVPKNGFSKKNTEIKFYEITNVYNENFYNNPCLIIRSKNQKIVIYKKILSPKDNFEKIENIIRKKTNFI